MQAGHLRNDIGHPGVMAARAAMSGEGCPGRNLAGQRAGSIINRDVAQVATVKVQPPELSYRRNVGLRPWRSTEQRCSRGERNHVSSKISMGGVCIGARRSNGVWAFP